MDLADRRLELLSPALRIILLISIPIAAFAPWDATFWALTFGSPWLRMVLIAVLATVGAAAGPRLGLRLEGHGARHPALIGWAAAILIAIYVLVLDRFLFRSQLDPTIDAFLHQPLGTRLAYFLPRAFNENVLYRLFAFSCIAWLLNRGRSSRPSTMTLAIAMVAAQVINITTNVVLQVSTPTTPLSLTYDALRYVVPGVVWAILYCRHGFATAEVASVGCHLFLQPGFSLLP